MDFTLQREGGEGLDFPRCAGNDRSRWLTSIVHLPEAYIDDSIRTVQERCPVLLLPGSCSMLGDQRLKMISYSTIVDGYADNFSRNNILSKI